MNRLLSINLAALPKPMNLGIISPKDSNPILVALWQSDNANLTLNEVKSLCQTS